MRVHKFKIDVTNLKDDHINRNVEMAFKDLLGNPDDFMAYTFADDNDVLTMYLYTDDNDISSEIYDILIDNRLIISCVEITNEVKRNYKNFPEIDSTEGPNFKLLKKFLDSNFCDDFALDYISENGFDNFKTDIAEKFFPNYLK